MTDFLTLMGVSNTFVPQSGGGGGYSAFKTITIDHTQCGSSDSTNFPTLFRTPSGTVNTVGTAVTWVSGDQFPSWVTGDSILINGVVYTVASISTSTAIVLTGSAGTQSGVNYNLFPEFRTVANGGSIQNTTTVAGITVPADLVVSSDNAGSSLYSWEIPFYDATTGIIELHAKIPTISHTVNTVYYIPYNNSSTTTFQGGSAGAAWDSFFAGVWHLPNGTSLTANDSTANGNTGSIVGSITAATGQIDGGASFPGSAGNNIDMGTPSSLNISADVTQSVWANINSYPGAAVLMGRWTDSGYGYSLLTIGSAFYALIEPFGGGSPWGVQNYSYSTTGTWIKIDMVFTPSVGMFFYINGSQVASYTTSPPSAQQNSVNFKLGGSTLNDYPFNGLLDEARVSTTSRSADWILTEYNNQNIPNSFYTVT